MADWQAVDGLLHELGAVRLAANETLRASDATVRDRIERAIREAADAVDRTIDSPADDEVVIRAWEQILVARQLLRSLRETVDHAREIALNSVELRRQAAALMVESLSVRKPKA